MDTTSIELHLAEKLLLRMQNGFTFKDTKCGHLFTYASRIPLAKSHCATGVVRPCVSLINFATNIPHRGEKLQSIFVLTIWKRLLTKFNPHKISQHEKPDTMQVVSQSIQPPVSNTSKLSLHGLVISTSGNCVPRSKPFTMSFTEEKPQNRRELLLDNAGSLRSIMEEYRLKMRSGRLIHLDDSDDDDSDDEDME